MNYTLTGRSQGNKWKVGDEVQVKSSYDVPNHYWGKEGKISSFFGQHATIKQKDGQSFLVNKTALKEINE